MVYANLNLNIAGFALETTCILYITLPQHAAVTAKLFAPDNKGPVRTLVDGAASAVALDRQAEKPAYFLLLFNPRYGGRMSP